MNLRTLSFLSIILFAVSGKLVSAQVIEQIEQEQMEQIYLFVSHEDPREEILILEKLLHINHG